MASTSAWALIGARSRYDIGIEATHLLQVIEGDRLVLEIRSLHEPQEITRWIPPSPQTVDIAMRALIAYSGVFEHPIRSFRAHLGGTRGRVVADAVVRSGPLSSPPSRSS